MNNNNPPIAANSSTNDGIQALAPESERSPEQSSSMKLAAARKLLAAAKLAETSTPLDTIRFWFEGLDPSARQVLATQLGKRIGLALPDEASLLAWFTEQGTPKLISGRALAAREIISYVLNNINTPSMEDAYPDVEDCPVSILFRDVERSWVMMAGELSNFFIRYWELLAVARNRQIERHPMDNALVSN